MGLINYLARIQFDAGAIRELGSELKQLGVTRPFIVTDQGVVKAGIIERVNEALKEQGFDAPPMFAEVRMNPTEDDVDKALEIYRAEKCDGVIGIGGGSCIDSGKSVALLSTHPGSLNDYAILAGGSEKITDKIAPMIAVPTTAGTGSEVGRALTVEFKGGHKAACVSFHLIPKVAVCDPELTYSLPPFLTAATGMDALCHGIESYCSPVINPPAETIGLDCVARCGTYLERAFADGGDEEARWNMLMAALEGGMTFQKGLGAVHASTHPLGDHGLHHGMANAMMMPPVLRFNESSVPDKFARLKEALRLPQSADLAQWVADLNERLGMPKHLSEHGISEDMIEDMARAAEKDHLSKTNPRPALAKDYAAFYREMI